MSIQCCKRAPFADIPTMIPPMNKENVFETYNDKCLKYLKVMNCKPIELYIYTRNIPMYSSGRPFSLSQTEIWRFNFLRSSIEREGTE